MSTDDRRYRSCRPRARVLDRFSEGWDLACNGCEAAGHSRNAHSAISIHVGMPKTAGEFQDRWPVWVLSWKRHQRLEHPTLTAINTRQHSNRVTCRRVQGCAARAIVCGERDMYVPPLTSEHGLSPMDANAWVRGLLWRPLRPHDHDLPLEDVVIIDKPSREALDRMSGQIWRGKGKR